MVKAAGIKLFPDYEISDRLPAMVGVYTQIARRLCEIVGEP